MITFDIISTGSKGNAVIFNETVLMDIGVSFKALTPQYKALDLVLLTHIHSDHFNRSTVRKIAQERPTLRFGCCEWMVRPLLDCEVSSRNIDVYRPDGAYDYGRFRLSPFRLIHDVPNCGYKLNFGSNGRMIYATDTNSISHVEAKGFDLYMLEANYSQEEIAVRIRQKQSNGEFSHEYGALKNHLSREKANDWLYANMSQNSRYVYLHEHQSR